MSYREGRVREVSAWTPLQNGLFTPELQWQSRGTTAYLTEVYLQRWRALPAPGSGYHSSSHRKSRRRWRRLPEDPAIRCPGHINTHTIITVCFVWGCVIDVGRCCAPARKSIQYLLLPYIMYGRVRMKVNILGVPARCAEPPRSASADESWCRAPRSRPTSPSRAAPAPAAARAHI